MNERNRGPKSDLARYAFGYSDKKPGKLFWVIHAGLVLFALTMVFDVSSQDSKAPYAKPSNITATP